MAYRISLIYIILCVLAKVQGRCHECQSNFAICHDENKFSMCADGISVNEMQTCPNDYVCTDQTAICVKSSTINPVQPTCDAGCGVCNSPGKLFACVNEKTYVYCFGADSYDNGATGQCPDEYVCNLGSRQICTPASEVYPSCLAGSSMVATTLLPIASPAVSPTLPPAASPTVSPTVPQTPPPTSDDTPATSTQHPKDESDFCRHKQNGGFYKSENDPTCKEYIMCWILSGQYLSIRYTCPGDYYFNENTNECQAAKPANC